MNEPAISFLGQLSVNLSYVGASGYDVAIPQAPSTDSLGASGFNVAIPQAPSIDSLDQEECQFIHALTQQYREGVICEPPAFDCAPNPNFYQVKVKMTGRHISVVGRGSTKEDAAKDAFVQIKEAASSSQQQEKPKGRSGIIS